MASKIEVILTRDVGNLGHIGDVVKVTPGYMRNCLVPQLLALPVSKSRLVQFEHQKQLVMHQMAKLKAVSENVRDRIEVAKFVIEVKAGDQGKIFGSVGGRDIEAVLKEHGFTVHHRDIKLEAPIKTLGLHEIPVRLEGGVTAKIKVIVAAIVEPVATVESDEDEFQSEAPVADDSEEDLA
jgi:large subunit ribosomal protein L9